MTRYAKRVDANHSEIREALKRAGWIVQDMSAVGDGFPDLHARKGSRGCFIEVKDGAKSPSRRQLTPAQVRVHALLQSVGLEVQVIETIEQAVNL